MTTTTTNDQYEAAIAYAAERGTSDGKAAASWYEVGDREDARRLIDMLEDGDPAAYDQLPSPNLSGEFADSLTGPQLEQDALAAAGVDDVAMPGASGEWFSDICDAYDAAFSTAAEDDIARRARDVGGLAGAMRAYVVQAVVQPGTIQLPTFYLLANVQGITSTASAERVARSVIQAGWDIGPAVSRIAHISVVETTI